MLTLAASIDGLVMLLIMLTWSSAMALEELAGREGGDGGAPAGTRWTLLGGTIG